MFRYCCIFIFHFITLFRNYISITVNNVPNFIFYSIGFSKRWSACLLNCLFRPQTFCATWISMNGLLYYVSLTVLRTCAYLLEFFRCPRKTVSPPAAPPFPQTSLFFLSNADPVFSVSNPDFSAILKLWLQT